MRFSPIILSLKNGINRLRLWIRKTIRSQKPRHNRVQSPESHDKFTPLQEAAICDRRHLFPALIREMMVTTGALKGRPSFVLTDINTFSDEMLEGIKPVINEQYQIYVEDNYVCSRLKTEPDNTMHLFARQHENLLVFNLFDGKHTLAEISQQIAQSLSWENDQAFKHTRKMFLLLLNLRVCVPSNPPSEVLKEVRDHG